MASARMFAVPTRRLYVHKTHSIHQNENIPHVKQSTKRIESYCWYLFYIAVLVVCHSKNAFQNDTLDVNPAGKVSPAGLAS
jgi:hypothetical protein